MYINIYSIHTDRYTYKAYYKYIHVIYIYIYIYYVYIHMCVLAAQSCPTLFNPKDCSPPGSSVHGIL